MKPALQVHTPSAEQVPRSEQKVPLNTHPASENVVSPWHVTLASVLRMRRFTAALVLATAIP